MKTLIILCLLAASLGAGELLPTHYFVKCDTVQVWKHYPDERPDQDRGVYPADSIVYDTTWIFPVVVDTIVKCTTVVDTLLWIELWSEGDKLDTIGVDTVYDDYQKCDTVYRRRP
jgi:hypothetical protein